MDREVSDSQGGTSPKRKAGIAFTEPAGPVYITGQEDVPGAVPSPFNGGNVEAE